MAMSWARPQVLKTSFRDSLALPRRALKKLYKPRFHTVKPAAAAASAVPRITSRVPRAVSTSTKVPKIQNITVW